MVMKLNTGVPGSGKTYLMVKSFIDLFCYWDKQIELYHLKAEHTNKVLISNIEGLKLDHLDIETLMSERCLQLARTKFIDNIGAHDIEEMEDVIDNYYYDFMQEKVRWFFNYDYQKSLSEKYGSIIYLIEECQRYFDGKELGRSKWVREIYYFFEKHRHMGFSIFCDTQHVSKISKGISCLFETETRAKPRTLSLLGEFKYNEYSDGMKTNSLPLAVKPNKKIFNTYKSMNLKEDVKTKKPALKILLFVCFMIFCSITIFNYAKKSLGPTTATASTIDNKKNVRPGGTSPGLHPDPPAAEDQKIKKWVVLSHVQVGNDISFIHPFSNRIVPIDLFDLPFKRKDNEFFCQISSNE